MQEVEGSIPFGSTPIFIALLFGPGACLKEAANALGSF
jgi:hypothetical protein